MPSCAIKWCGKCTTTSSYTKDGISFHRFPNDAPSSKELWIKATHRENFFPTKHSVICSRHFTPDCFENLKNSRRRLYSLSVPTLHLPTLTLSADTQDEPTSSREIKTELSKSTISSAASKSTQHQPSSIGTKTESPKTTTSDGEKNKELYEQYVDLTPNTRKMKRHIDHLICSLNKQKKKVKKLQDKTRALKKKVASLQKIIDLRAN